MPSGSPTVSATASATLMGGTLQKVYGWRPLKQ